MDNFLSNWRALFVMRAEWLETKKLTSDQFLFVQQVQK